MTQQNNAIDTQFPIFLTNGGTGVTNGTSIITTFAVPQCKSKNMLIGSDFMNNPIQYTNAAQPIVGTGTVEVADRWVLSQQGTGTITYAVEYQDETNPPITYTTSSGPSGWGQPVGYIYLSVTGGDSQPATSDYTLYTNIEGSRWQQYAQVPLVLSFWVYVPVAGTYCCGLSNFAGGAQYANAIIFEYEVESANTWQWVEIQIPPSPSTGQWSYDWGLPGVQVSFNFGGGSNTQKVGPVGVWNDIHGTHTALQTNAIVASSAICIGNIQIERGNYATGFECRDAALELYQCQRFRQMTYIIGSDITNPFANSYDNITGGAAGVSTISGSTSGYIYVPFATPMCVVPQNLNLASSNGGSGSANCYKTDGTVIIKGVNIRNPANLSTVGPHSSAGVFVQLFGDSYSYGQFHYYATNGVV